MRLVAFVLGLVLSGSLLWAQDFSALSQWEFWARDKTAGAITALLQDNRPVVRIEHQGKQDWSLRPHEGVAVTAGDIIEFTLEYKLEGTGEAAPSFETRDTAGKVVNWTAAYHALDASPRWQSARARMVVPQGVTQVFPRVIGYRAATIWVAAAKFSKKGNILDNSHQLPRQVILENNSLVVNLDPLTLTFAVQDKRTGQTWKQLATQTSLMATAISQEKNRISARLFDLEDDRPLTLELALDPQRPELLVAIASEGKMTASLQFPAPFGSTAGQYLVIPMNEGISYPVDDPSMFQGNLIAYGGHGICMPFFGVTDGKAGYLSILQTPDDAGIHLQRTDGLGWVAPVWDSQKGQFGYTRKLRYVFFSEGGHVGIAKRYRQDAQERGLLKTFTQKRMERPDIDKLIGAVNIWCWDENALPIVRELQAAGIDHILWSNKAKPQTITQLNTFGVLTSRYDIYQDLMDPAQFPRLQYIHPDWTTAGWPKDLILKPDGQWLHGWEIEVKNSNAMIPCGVLCDLKAPAYALERIEADLKTHPYHCRFIDTTTAAPWRECYNPDHPMTRTQSREAKMKLLAVISDHFKLICGSETGHEAAVPYCDDFEGMLSLGPYRVPDSGRAMDKVVNEVPPRLAQFQVGEKYRLPLWELVYHDCCIAQWYWGDYNNKLPSIWWKRDLFNALYGTPPMFWFTRDWKTLKDRFVASYRATAPIARATGYSEMTDHRFLTADRSVQQTTFANGVRITVNFGDSEFRTANGKLVPSHGVYTEGF